MSNTRLVARIRGRRRTWSDGTTRCVSGWAVSSARACRSLNLRPCMRSVCDCFCIVTISRLPHPVEPLPKILSLLGAGGMGEVYRALDTRLDRQVAVKVLPPHLAQDPEALARFRREAK